MNGLNSHPASHEQFYSCLSLNSFIDKTEESTASDRKQSEALIIVLAQHDGGFQTQNEGFKILFNHPLISNTPRYPAVVVSKTTHINDFTTDQHCCTLFTISRRKHRSVHGQT